jgi:tRNA 2-selenouridine synthase
MVIEISIGEALKTDLPIIDVRSPGEFMAGHIPNATNVPLFSNEERAHIGTVYKQVSQEAAIKLGYTYVDPKLTFFIEKSKELAPNQYVVVHCWRGGMRSHAFAQHLSDNGFEKVYVITGGYKAYRNFMLNTLSTPFKLILLGGYTGSGKTHILKQLKNNGHQVVDLEALANHKGSAFGSIGEVAQPTVEQFQNNLLDEWLKLDFSKPIWVEDESLSIGKVTIPMPLFSQMRSSKLIFIDIPKEERAKHLVSEYTRCTNQLLADAIMRIGKRLGGQHVAEALKQLELDNYYEVAMIALNYYDKSYQKGLNHRTGGEIETITLNNTDHSKNATIIIKHIEENGID